MIKAAEIPMIANSIKAMPEMRVKIHIKYSKLKPICGAGRELI
jgi:hypothetical protein